MLLLVVSAVDNVKATSSTSNFEARFVNTSGHRTSQHSDIK